MTLILRMINKVLAEMRTQIYDRLMKPEIDAEINDAIERVMAGPEKKDRVMSEKRMSERSGRRIREREATDSVVCSALSSETRSSV